MEAHFHQEHTAMTTLGIIIFVLLVFAELGRG